MRITYLDVTSVESGFVSLNASSHPWEEERVKLGRQSKSWTENATECYVYSLYCFFHPLVCMVIIKQCYMIVLSAVTVRSDITVMVDWALKINYLSIRRDCKTLVYVMHFYKHSLLVLLLYYVRVCVTFSAYAQ